MALGKFASRQPLKRMCFCDATLCMQMCPYTAIQLPRGLFQNQYKKFFTHTHTHTHPLKPTCTDTKQQQGQHPDRFSHIATPKFIHRHTPIFCTHKHTPISLLHMHTLLWRQAWHTDALIPTATHTQCLMSGTILQILKWIISH